MPIDLNADAGQPWTRMDHFWSRCVGAGRACEGLRASWQEQLRKAVADCGFKYIRFHGLFHDDMFVYREIDGEAVYNFQYPDELFDRLLSLARPLRLSILRRHYIPDRPLSSFPVPAKGKTFQPRTE